MGPEWLAMGNAVSKMKDLPWQRIARELGVLNQEVLKDKSP